MAEGFLIGFSSCIILALLLYWTARARAKWKKFVSPQVVEVAAGKSQAELLVDGLRGCLFVVVVLVVVVVAILLLS